MVSFNFIVVCEFGFLSSLHIVLDASLYSWYLFSFSFWYDLIARVSLSDFLILFFPQSCPSAFMPFALCCSLVSVMLAYPRLVTRSLGCFLFHGYGFSTVLFLFLVVFYWLSAPVSCSPSCALLVIRLQCLFLFVSFFMASAVSPLESKYQT